MIFLVQFGINKQPLIFSKPQIARTLRARAILLVSKIYESLFIPNCTRNRVITYTNCTPLSSITIIITITNSFNIIGAFAASFFTNRFVQL